MQLTPALPATILGMDREEKMNITRRFTLGTLFGGSMSAAIVAPPKRPAALVSDSGIEWAQMKWAQGVEGQRKADLGNGTFLNPIVAGNHPDPSILKDGKDYYLSSRHSMPIRRSRCGTRPTW